MKAALIAALVFPDCSRAESAELRIDFAALATIAQAALGDAKLRLHNVPSTTPSSNRGSFVSIAGRRYPFDVGSRTFDAAGASYAYYLAGINTSAIAIAPTTGALRLSLTFESDGPELVGECTAGMCAPPGALPVIEWVDGPGLVIELAPIRALDTVSFEVRRVEIAGRLEPVCTDDAGLIAASLCRAVLPRVRRSAASLMRHVDEALKSAMNRVEVQQAIAAALRQKLVLGQAGTVRVRRVTVDRHGVVVSFCLAC